MLWSLSSRHQPAVMEPLHPGGLRLSLWHMQTKEISCWVCFLFPLFCFLVCFFKHLKWSPDEFKNHPLDLFSMKMLYETHSSSAAAATLPSYSSPCSCRSSSASRCKQSGKLSATCILFSLQTAAGWQKHTLGRKEGRRDDSPLTLSFISRFLVFSEELGNDEFGFYISRSIKRGWARGFSG